MNGRSIAYALATCLLLAGCGTYSEKAVLIKDALSNSDYPKALEQTEKIDKGSSELLYLYEKGLILHSEGRYQESNEALEAAELLFEDLYTKSLTREAGALVISDQVTTCRGEAFETTFVNYYKMLNYWYLGSPEGAMVEARRLNDKIKFLPNIEDSVYVESPFLQWTSGMIFEQGNERSDADVSYRRAIDSYRQQSQWLQISPPTELACDLVANGEALGDRDLRDQYDDPCGSADGAARDNNAANVTLFVECGFVAGKVSRELVVPIYKGETDGSDYSDAVFAEKLVHRIGEPPRRLKIDYVLKVALPDLVTPPSTYGRARIRAISESDTLQQDLALAEDLNVWASRAFSVKLPRAILRTILRGLIKYASKKKAEKEDQALGWLVNAIGVATERADTRTWSTLPERIFVTHLALPEGTWRLDVDVFSPVGRRVAWLSVPEFQVTAGQRTFLNYRVH
jgi:hypothetical protein